MSKTQIQSFLTAAQGCLDKPYEYGAVGPDSFDCSGLVLFAAQAAGWSACPRTSSEQSREGKAVTRSELAPGDLVCLDFNDPPAKVQHIGIYVGDGQMINAQSTSPASVTLASIDTGYWSKRIMGFRRVFDSGESDAIVERELVAAAGTADTTATSSSNVATTPTAVPKPKDVLM